MSEYNNLNIRVDKTLKNDMNAETLAAMGEFYEMKKHPEKYKRYKSFADVISEVKNDV